MDDARDPTLEDLLLAHSEVTQDGIHTLLPSVIVSYDEVKQTASVQAQVMHRRLDEDGETVISKPYPVVNNCPVVFCGPARGRITWPVAAGDTCELRLASASIQRWAAQGGLVDPGEDRRHDLTDGVCQVGLHSPASPPTDAPTDAVVVHLSGGVLLKLGSSGADESGVLGDTYLSAESTWLSALEALATTLGTLGSALASVHAPTGAYPDPGSASGGSGVVAAATNINIQLGLFLTALATYKSTKVKLE